MKKLVFIILFVSLTLLSPAQDWVQSYSAWHNSHSSSLFEYYDHGYVFTLDWYPTGYKDFCLVVKTDINGNKLWVVQLGNGTYWVFPSNASETIDHGIIVCGVTDKYGGANGDLFLAKINFCAELEWCKVILTPGIFDNPYCIKQAPNGDYILLAGYSDPNPYNRIQLYKFNSVGNLLWKHNYPATSGVSNEDGSDLQILDDGYLISGNCYYPVKDDPKGVSSERPYYIKTDTSGNDIWRLVYGKNNGYWGISGYNTLKTPAGNFYNVGWHSNYCDTPGLTKFMADGSESYFQDVFPAACPGGDGSMNFLNDTTLVLLVGGTVNGTSVLKWIKIDTLGIEKYAKPFPNGTYVNGTGWTIVTTDKKILAMADYNQTTYLYKLTSDFEPDSNYQQPRVYDSLCPHPVVTTAYNLDCDLIVNVDEPVAKPGKTQMNIFPNPAIDKVTVDFPEYLVFKTGSGMNSGSTTYHQWKFTILDIYDPAGKQVLSREIPYLMKELEIDVSSWSVGTYQFRLVFENKTVAGKTLIIRR